VSDVDVDGGFVTVRDGKSGATARRKLPESLTIELRMHLLDVRWQYDRELTLLPELAMCGSAHECSEQWLSFHRILRRVGQVDTS
jgi:hypothetical protein